MYGIPEWTTKKQLHQLLQKHWVQNVSSRLPKDFQLQRADGPINRKVLEDVEDKLVKRKMVKMVEKMDKKAPLDKE